MPIDPDRLREHDSAGELVWEFGRKTGSRRPITEGSRPVPLPLARAVHTLWDRVVSYALKFGVVGLIGLVIDVGLFNLLRFGPLGGEAWVTSALGAKTVSTSAAIVFNWAGNRYWTFRAERRSGWFKEFLEYLVVSLGGMGVSLLCLWFSHHVLDLTSALADNISANVVGLALGTIFRFVLYRYWVWGHHRDEVPVSGTRLERAEEAVFTGSDADAQPPMSRQSDPADSA